MYILTNPDALTVAEFASTYPMRPRNPGTGNGDPQQLQAWIAGPDSDGKTVVLLANYGPDQGQGGFNTGLTGSQEVTVSWGDLGISGNFTIQNVWDPSQEFGLGLEQLSASLNEGQSLLVIMTPAK